MRNFNPQLTTIAFLIPASLLIWFYTLDLFTGILALIPVFAVFAIAYAYTPKEVVLEYKQLVIKKVFGKTKCTRQHV